MSVTQQILNDPEIYTVLEQMGGKAVPERMYRDAVVQSRSCCSLAAMSLKRSGCQRFCGIRTREQPYRWTCYPPVLPQNVEQLLRQHDKAVSAAFALAHIEHHPYTVNVGQFEADHLRYPQTSRVDNDQRSGKISWSQEPEENFLEYL